MLHARRARRHGAWPGSGLGGLIQPWLADPSIVMLTLFVIISWKYFGFHMILLLAGLQGIPRELEEAAAIDGAAPLAGDPLRDPAAARADAPGLGLPVDHRRAPAVRPVWVTTGGGPVNASNTMATYMFDWGFRRFQLGYGSAVAVILFGLSFALALAYQRFVLRRDTEGAITTAGG